MGIKNGELEVKIAICGKLRSGKNEVADTLTDYFRFTQFAFSNGIKEVGKLLFPNEFNRREKPRQLLQRLGQKLREVHPNIWVNYTFNEMDEVGAKRIVVTDLRQPNELEALKEDGFHIIRVNATDETRLKRSREAGDDFTLKDMQHETELHVDSFEVDYDIDNNGTLADLDEQTLKIANEIFFREKGLQHYKKGAQNAGGQT
ncbi:AAA family ATPase [Halobacillus ihumii]|uniref:deoxynucleotide monophosphate kinase family protein n=1 Tax=Halobacillus ihumii TaxID=2686092 RepID=UPI0019681C06|nr:hypothetical protein [Halobacillus ihumii]